MDPRYDIKEVEARIYKMWEDSGFFNPDNLRGGEGFSIVLPPPNVTGTLHIGHAFEDTIQDVVIRYERMKGKRALWIPGTDHAAIATQARVEKLLEKEGKKKYDLGREEFLRRVEAFAQESHDTIVRQVKRLGASLDWSREAYTLDDARSLAVRTAFKKMYDLGLIYRGDRVVNWDPKAQTVISDDEVVYEERRTKLYTFRYAAGFPIPISTTRPETKVGDTAIAVHPADERYKKFIGQEFEIDFIGVPLLIKIIGDESVDREFGTGALGVTPAHSMIDWEMAQKHGLPLVQVIDEHARMKIASAPESSLNGLKTTEAREKIVDELRAAGLLEKEEEITQNVSTAERTGAVIEPLPKLQWFVAVNKRFKNDDLRFTNTKNSDGITLKELMREAVESGEVKILPERFEKIYYYWIENLRDWCISRQIWFGHRIPVWYKNRATRYEVGGMNEEIYVGVEAPTGDGWEQDPDTLDTWFSSGLWPFSTLGWPNETDDMKNYFPNSFMGPGYEILFFWVARMILMSGALLGQVPFRTVYLHGIVRDAKGEKFSKSKGNGIDPLELADKYGADALRMALIVGAAPGNDVKFDEQRVKGYRNFATKIWNIARFVETNRGGTRYEVRGTNETNATSAHTPLEHQYLKELAALKIEITANLDAYDFHLAAEKIYHYIWHTLADKIIEAEKPKLHDGSAEEKATSYALLEYLLLESIKILHPFMPFITEEIYQIFRPGKILMIEQW
jgi:valyl-tRNA synthetase